ncbi:MAG TPA: hypothetical protein VF813_04500, partial [Anaerolineaceae bacterium]
MRELPRILLRSFSALACLAALLTNSLPAAAQAGQQVQLFPPDITQFPVVTALLDVRGPNGSFLSGLQAAQVSLVENGRTIPVDELKEKATPLEISVAVDPAPSMAVYTLSGQTRYDLIATALNAWAKQPSSGQPDHFNLFAPNSAAATGLSYRSDWLGAFNNLKIDL